MNRKKDVLSVNQKMFPKKEKEGIFRDINAISVISGFKTNAVNQDYRKSYGINMFMANRQPIS
jgi:hypothetical protein